jgi:hypothetical protein
MNLPPRQRRYLLVGQMLIPAVVNVIACGVFAVVDYRNLDALPVWGFPQSMAMDLIGTSILLPAITCLIATTLIRRDLRQLVVEAIGDETESPMWIGWLPRSLLRRSAMCGLAGGVFVGIPVATVLLALPVNALSIPAFLAAKLTFAAIYGALVTPFIAIRALCDTQRDAPDTVIQK